MKTLKNLVIASTLALALSFSQASIAEWNLTIGYPVYSVAEGDQIPVSQLPTPIEAYYVNDVVYLHSTGLSEDNTLHVFADAESVEENKGNIIVTDGCETTYIYTTGDNATIISFLENL